MKTMFREWLLTVGVRQNQKKHMLSKTLPSKETWLLGEFEGRWATRRQDGEWGTDAWDDARTGVSERLPSQPRGNVGAIRMDTSECRCRRDTLRSTGAR
jgi:hypothetical protein